MPLKFPAPKAPGDVLDHVVRWLVALDGDTIVSSSWTIPTGLTMTQDSFTSTETTVWLGGGTAGQTYDLVNTITTALGRTLARTIQLAVDTM